VFGLSFLNLPFLALAIALPVLVLAYFRKPRYKKRPVGSLFILKQLPESAELPKKLHFPLRLFLELLALALLVFAGLRPFFAESSNLVAVFLDDSMSMSARNSSGNSRLSELSKNFSVDDQIASAKFHLYQGSGSLETPSEELSLSELKERIREVAPTNFADKAGLKASKLLANKSYQKVIIISDQESLSENERLQVISSSADSGMEELANLYLLSPKKSKKENKLKISAKIHLSQTARLASESVSPTVRLLAYKAGGQTIELSQKKVEVRGLSEDIKFIVASNTLEDVDAFQIKLEAPLGVNSIQADDSLWLLAKSDTLDKQLIVSPDFASLKRSGLENLKGFNFTLLSPEEYAGQDLSPYSWAIFHKFTPSSFPAISSFFILPPEGNSLFPVRTSEDSISFAAYKASHPLNRYLKPWLLDGSPAAILNPPAWTEKTIEAEAGPVVLTGESGVYRFVASGLELLPFEGESSPLSSVLFLNSLAWIRAEASINEYRSTGSILSKDEAPETLVGLRGESLKPGELIRSPGPYSSNGKLNFIANSIFPSESDTAPKKYLGLDTSAEAPEATKDRNADLWRVALLLALAVLCADFLIRIFRSHEPA